MRAIPIFLLPLLLSACGTMQIGETSFIRPDSNSGAAVAAHLDFAALLPEATVTEESIVTPDGAILHGISVHQGAGAHAILYFGGNLFHLDQHGKEVLPLLTSCGTDVALFDYRGYGRSSGAPTVATMQADALRMFDHVSARHPGGVIVHGQSLGSFMAAYVAAERPSTRGLVLEATSTNVREWADANVPWYFKLFMKIDVGSSLRGMDNSVAVARYRGASLVLSGDKDKVTPARLARKVYEAIPGNSKQWFVAEGAGHNGIFGHPEVRPLYCAFVGQTSPGTAQQ